MRTADSAGDGPRAWTVDPLALARRLCLVLAAVALCAGCRPHYRWGPRPTLIPGPKPREATYSTAADALELAGCYRVRFQEPADDGGVRIWNIRLDSLGPYPNVPGSGKGRPGARRASSSSGVRGRTGYWGKMTNGVQIDLGDSLHGVMLELAPWGGVLRGRAFFYTDTWPAYFVERVAARKVPCSEAEFPEVADPFPPPRQGAR